MAIGREDNILDPGTDLIVLLTGGESVVDHDLEGGRSGGQRRFGELISGTITFHFCCKKKFFGNSKFISWSYVIYFIIGIVIYKF